MEICRIVVLCIFCTVPYASSVPTVGSGHLRLSTGQRTRSTTNLRTTVSGSTIRSKELEKSDDGWKEFWNEDWTDWVLLRNVSAGLPKHLPRLTEAQFLTLLHMDYRQSNATACEDKNRQDCPVWANLRYCEHDHQRFSYWMTENCAQSCGLCDSLQVKQESQCKNFKTTCDRLSRFCVGPFQSHMVTWCPRSCQICNSSYEVEDGSDADSDSVESVANLKATPVEATYLEAVDEEQLCYPLKCGRAPVMKNRRNILNVRPRFRRSITLEARMRRSAPATVRTRVGNPRIVGGSWAKRGEWPWHGMVLQKVGRYIRFCGVTIICNRWLVTAAHCLASKDFGFPDTRDKINTFTVYVGRHQGMFGYMESTTQIFSKAELKRFILHPKFKIMPSFSYDIALIELSTPIEFNSYVQPVCLAKSNTLTEKDKLWAYGWGATYKLGPDATYLKKLALPFVSRENCSEHVWALPKYGVLCAGGEAKQDTCTGDSGGSLVKENDDGRYYMYGVTSFGNKNCNTKYPYSPGIYTDVGQYYDWITNQTNSCCNSRWNGVAFLKDAN